MLHRYQFNLDRWGIVCASADVLLFACSLPWSQNVCKCVSRVFSHLLQKHVSWIQPPVAYSLSWFAISFPCTACVFVAGILYLDGLGQAARAFLSTHILLVPPCKRVKNMLNVSSRFAIPDFDPCKCVYIYIYIHIHDVLNAAMLSEHTKNSRRFAARRAPRCKFFNPGPFCVSCPLKHRPQSHPESSSGSAWTGTFGTTSAACRRPVFEFLACRALYRRDKWDTLLKLHDGKLGRCAFLFFFLRHAKLSQLLKKRLHQCVSSGVRGWTSGSQSPPPSAQHIQTQKAQKHICRLRFRDIAREHFIFGVPA